MPYLLLIHSAHTGRQIKDKSELSQNQFVIIEVKVCSSIRRITILCFMEILENLPSGFINLHYNTAATDNQLALN